MISNRYPEQARPHGGALGCGARPHDHPPTARMFPGPLSSEYGTYKTVMARSRPWLSVKGLKILARCFLFARQRNANSSWAESIELS